MRKLDSRKKMMMVSCWICGGGFGWLRKEKMLKKLKVCFSRMIWVVRVWVRLSLKFVVLESLSGLFLLVFIDGV